MIYITGASGFVGQHLTDFFTKKNIAWRTLDLRKTGWQHHIQLIPGSIIIHLAGKAHDHKRQSTKEDFFEVNFKLTQMLYDLFLQSQSSTFIHISTIAAVNELGSKNPITESETPAPSTFYGLSKRAAEEYLLQSDSIEKKTIILRPAMIHGPNDKGNLSLLYRFVDRNIPYPLGAYDNKRSFLSIDNLLFVLDKICQHAPKLSSGIYNVVDDEPVSTTQIIKMMAEERDAKPKIWKISKTLIAAAARIGDAIGGPLNTTRLKKMTSDLVVSNQKLKQALGLEALPVNSIDGLRNTIRSFIKK